MYPVTTLKASYIYIYSQLSKRRCNLLHTEIAFTFPYPLHRVNQYRRRRIQGGKEEMLTPLPLKISWACAPPPNLKKEEKRGAREKRGIKRVFVFSKNKSIWPLLHITLEVGGAGMLF